MKRSICLLLLISLLLAAAGCSSGYSPKIPKSELPQLSDDRKEMILEICKARGFDEDLTFADPSAGKEGIRYYGSYTYETSLGKEETRDYIYIPFESLSVASELDYGGYIFRSRSGFCLYTFETYTYGDGEIMKFLYPLAFPLYEGAVLSDEAAARISYALDVHNTYEYWIHGSVLTKMPEIRNAQETMRVQAVWLLRSGAVVDFEAASGGDYWGKFGGYDVFFDEGVALAETTIRIGDVEFTHGSSFVLMLHKDGKFCTIQHAYENGLISDETVREIKQSRLKP